MLVYLVVWAYNSLLENQIWYAHVCCPSRREISFCVTMFSLCNKGRSTLIYIALCRVLPGMWVVCGEDLSSLLAIGGLKSVQTR